MHRLPYRQNNFCNAILDGRPGLLEEGGSFVRMHGDHEPFSGRAAFHRRPSLGWKNGLRWNATLPASWVASMVLCPRMGDVPEFILGSSRSRSNTSALFAYGVALSLALLLLGCTRYE